MTCQLAVKSVFDRIAALAALILTLPVWAAVALAVRMEDGGPVFFVQERIGQHGKTFLMYKFRSMMVDSRPVVNKDGSLRVDKSDPRVTRIGAFLRRTSLDELPQLINVLMGQMSLVGPRPDLPEHLALYSETDKLKLRMRPGLTGLPQVMGRNDLPWKERIRLDNLYIDNFSLLWDFKILFGTFYAVATGRGVTTNRECGHDGSHVS